MIRVVMAAGTVTAVSCNLAMADSDVALGPQSWTVYTCGA